MDRYIICQKFYKLWHACSRFKIVLLFFSQKKLSIFITQSHHRYTTAKSLNRSRLLLTNAIIDTDNRKRKAPVTRISHRDTGRVWPVTRSHCDTGRVWPVTRSHCDTGRVCPVMRSHCDTGRVCPVTRSHCDTGRVCPVTRSHRDTGRSRPVTRSHRDTGRSFTRDA
jgi:hypothetical protein